MSEGDSNQTQQQTIQAVAFEAPQEAGKQANTSTNPQSDFGRGLLQTSSAGPWWHSQFNLMLAVFGLLVAAALLFVFLTPAPELSRATLVDKSGNTSEVEPSAPVDAAKDEAAPYDESASAQARTDSQGILSDLLAAKKELEAKQVEQWADAEYSQALAMATQGDELYKKREYAQAIEQYKQSLNALTAIDELIPQQLDKQVKAGLTAISEGKSSLAKQEFEFALRLDQDHIPALDGMSRVATLDQVLELASAAAADEQTFSSSDDLSDLALAKQKYQQALTLDALSPLAIDGLARVESLISDKQYRLAMSDGFNALFARSYGRARSGFSKALKVMPNDETASAALRQALAADKRSSLSSLLKAAKRFEASEEWSSALSNYQTVLQRDANQVAAKIGSIRSKARVQLDRAIKETLQDQLALSKVTKKTAALDVLEDAKRVAKKGPILTEQINDLEVALKQIDTNVRVVFQSDSLTQVSLVKAGSKRISLGKFKNKNLALKPGRYVLNGERLGFHDVRTELTLEAGSAASLSFTIACNEPIADAS